MPLATVFRCNQYQIGGRKWGAKGVAQHKLAEIKSALVVRASWKQSEKEFFDVSKLDSVISNNLARIELAPQQPPHFWHFVRTFTFTSPYNKS